VICHVAARAASSAASCRLRDTCSGPSGLDTALGDAGTLFRTSTAMTYLSFPVSRSTITCRAGSTPSPLWRGSAIQSQHI
jgi:hypothetical protein